MIKRILLLLVLLFLIKTGYCQQAPYIFPLPQNWGTEKINFPITFAPKIAFKGVEELRFTPGWNDRKARNTGRTRSSGLLRASRALAAIFCRIT
jgi:hypothetical protein